MKIAMITAGGAGMFCGSCMQDNTLARALRDVGHEVTLVPTYTPIKVDEENVSVDRVFLGGINVYLDSVVPGWSRLPRFLKSWLDRPHILRLLIRSGSSTDAARLGPLTVDMLRGVHGPQRDEIHQLMTWLVEDLKPDLILFSNALLSGIVPALRQRFHGRIVCLLQGDDIFLDALPDRWRQTSIDLVRDNSQHFDRLITHSRWYVRHLADSIGLDPDRFLQIPLSIDCEQPGTADEKFNDSGPKTIGYFARICPEKGVDNFLNAAQLIAATDDSLQFRIAGYLPELHRRWFQTRLEEVQHVVGSDRLQWLGSPQTREDKFRLLSSYDLLCVPADYREPKAIFMLEAALAGVPSLVPDHGAFPERIRELGRGWTYPATSATALAPAIQHAVGQLDSETSKHLCRTVRQKFAATVTGPVISQVLEQIAAS